MLTYADVRVRQRGGHARAGRGVGTVRGLCAAGIVLVKLVVKLLVVKLVVKVWARSGAWLRQV